TVTSGRLRLSIGIATERPWWKHYDPGVPRTLTYPAVPLQQFLSDTAALHPRSIATIFGAVVGHRLIEGSLTYAELDRLADRFAAGLQSLGVRKGDRVALLLPNCPQFDRWRSAPRTPRSSSTPVARPACRRAPSCRITRSSRTYGSRVRGTRRSWRDSSAGWTSCRSSTCTASP